MADDKHPQLKSLRDTIKEKVAALAPSRVAQLTDMWTQELLDKWCAAALPGIVLLDKMEAAMKRHKPMESYDENGKVKDTFWTKPQLDDRKKAQEDIDKLRKLLEESIVSGETNDLNQFVKSRSDKGKSQEASAGKPTADTD